MPHLSNSEALRRMSGLAHNLRIRLEQVHCSKWEPVRHEHTGSRDSRRAERNEL